MRYLLDGLVERSRTEQRASGDIIWGRRRWSRLAMKAPCVSPSDSSNQFRGLLWVGEVQKTYIEADWVFQAGQAARSPSAGVNGPLTAAEGGEAVCSSPLLPSPTSKLYAPVLLLNHNYHALHFPSRPIIYLAAGHAITMRLNHGDWYIEPPSASPFL